VGLQAVATPREGLFDDEHEPEDFAARFFDDLPEGFGGPASGEEVVYDCDAHAGLEHTACNLHPVFGALGRRRHLPGEGVALAHADVLLGVHHRNPQRLGRHDGGWDPARLRSQNEVRPDRCEPLGDLISNLGKDRDVDPMVEEVVDLEQAALHPGLRFDRLAKQHGRIVPGRLGLGSIALSWPIPIPSGTAPAWCSAA
jgi:hypothetical protein